VEKGRPILPHRARPCRAKVLRTGAGPTPEQLLAASVVNCLGASLLFAIRKYRNDPGVMRASAELFHTRNPANRLRIGRIAVELHLGVPANTLQSFERSLAQF
jgi:uncharacterized OsmC-like protein